MTTLAKAMRSAMVAAALLVAGGALVGCDDGSGGWGDGGYSDGGYYDTGGYSGGGYGPIDPDVFQDSVDNFSEYLRS